MHTCGGPPMISHTRKLDANPWINIVAKTDHITQAAAVYSEDFRVAIKLPFGRNQNFCGRQDIVEKLCLFLEPRPFAQHPHNAIESSPGRKTAVLYGMGGIGKSQIALKYAHDYAECYTSILWIDANDFSSTIESACKCVEQIVAHYVSKSGASPDYQAISNILGIPGKINSSGKIIKRATNLAIEAVHTWLSATKNQGWLLLIDNYDKAEEKKLEKLFPTCDWGSVLVTTRLANLGRIGKLVEVEGLGAEASLELLLKSSGKHEEQPNDLELGKAKEIIIALGELPLALDQAGAYIKFLRIVPFSDYRDRLEKGMKACFKRDIQVHGLPADKASILTTWRLSFEELSEEAKKLLYLCAFLSNEDIPTELFHRGSSAVNWIKELKDKDRFEDAIGELFAFSLAKPKNPSDASFWVHPSAIGGSSSEKSSVDWIFERRIFSHLGVCKDNISKYFKESDNGKVSSASMTIGRTYNGLGYYKQAKALYLISLEVYEKTLGTDHISTLNTVDAIASALYELGRYDEAIQWFQRALAGKERGLGQDHLSTMKTVNNMANVFESLGRYNEALKWYQRALAASEKVVGKDVLFTLGILNNIGVAFAKKAQYKDALGCHQRVLAGREKAVGKDNIKIMCSVINMAWVFEKQARYDEALKSCQRVLAMYEKALGKDHPATLEPVHIVASIFNNQGLYGEALEWCQRAMAGSEKALGNDHPETLGAVHTIASVLSNLGRYDEALEWCQRSLVGFQKAFGNDHPDTLGAVHTMASVFSNLGRYDEALEWCQMALKGLEKTIGNDHPDTLGAVHTMASVLSNLGRFRRSAGIISDGTRGERENTREGPSLNPKNL
ncbi:hypothetical protein RUND412_004696 [Rhizina undulata]